MTIRKACRQIFKNKIFMYRFKTHSMCTLLFQDKVMLGTDYPFPLGELEPGTLIESMHEFDGTLKVPSPYCLYLTTLR